MNSISTEQFDGRIFAQEGEAGKVWNVRPFQLVNLLDMIQFYAEYLHLTSSLISEKNVASKNLEFLEKSKPFTPEQLEESKGNVLRALKLVRVYCQRIGLDFTLMYIDTKQEELERAFSMRAAVILWDELLIHIENELSRRLFMLIPHEDAKNYEQEELFGAEVRANFESASDDIKEAGNCYAVSRYTACVFHCMRVLEKGLHALVHDLNNRFSAGITFPRAIEATSCRIIIDQIELAVTRPTRIQMLTPQPTPEELIFYSKAAKEFEHFREAWRNEVSHSRRSYDENESKAVMGHVKAFMQHLATKLHE